MATPNITIRETREIALPQLLNLYRANGWSSAKKPQQLIAALMNSHKLVSAWEEDLLVGLGNSLSDGHLVVYYPHLLVLPSHHGKGIGHMIMERLQKDYAGFHSQILVSDQAAIEFYKSCGFSKAGQTVPMWIYEGDDH